MENQEQGISLGEIFHVVFIKKWLLLAITVVVMLVGVLFTELFYNKSQETYQIEYEIKFPGVSGNKYPDGMDIVYRDFISLDNLENIKESDEAFSSIDIERMIEKNEISILPNLKEGEAQGDTLKLKLGVLKKYFSSYDQAKLFLLKICETPVDYALGVVQGVNYDSNLIYSNSAGDYTTEVEYLINQRQIILGGYDSLIATYTDGYVIGGKTLKELKAEVVSYFERKNLEALITEVSINGYVKANTDFIVSIERKKTDLENEKALNNIKIINLQQKLNELLEIYNNAGSSVQLDALKSFNEEIVSLTVRNSEIDYTIEYVYNVYLDGDRGKEEYLSALSLFENSVSDFKTNLTLFTQTFSEVNHRIFEDNTKLVYNATSQVLEVGGFSMILEIPVFLILGFIVASCVNLVIDMPKYLKNKKEEKVKEITTETK